MVQLPEIDNIHPTHKLWGSYFTPKIVAEWLGQHVFSMWIEEHPEFEIQKIKTLRICDPAAGEGVLLLTIAKILKTKYLLPSQEISECLVGFELQEPHFNNMISKFKVENGIIQPIHLKNIDGLTGLEEYPQKFDIIIGNPPYLRQETLSKAEKTKLSLVLKNHDQTNPELMQDFSKQSDYYIYFILIGIEKLNPGGILGYIVSTSWMNTKFGQKFRSFLLTKNLKIHIAYTPSQKLIPNAEINTIILIIQKPSDKMNLRTQNQQKILCWELSEPNFSKLNIDEPLIITSQKEFKKQEIKATMNWETYFFRIPHRFFKYLIRFESHLKPLSEFTSLSTGIYTGLNDFYYITKSKKKEHSVNPDPIFLVPIIRSPKEIKSWEITANKLSTSLFLCRKSAHEIANQYSATLKYLEWGKQQKTKSKQKVKAKIPWPEVSSVRKRKPGWWAMPPKIHPAKVFLRYIYYKDFLQPYCSKEIFSDRCFHQLYPHSKINARTLSLILNFELTKLFIEINGRNTLGQGALKFETMTAKNLPILDCFNAPFWKTEIQPTITQIKQFEIQAYQFCGISDPEEFYQKIHDLHQELVGKRVKK